MMIQVYTRDAEGVAHVTKEGWSHLIRLMLAEYDRRKAVAERNRALIMEAAGQLAESLDPSNDVPMMDEEGDSDGPRGPTATAP